MRQGERRRERRNQQLGGEAPKRLFRERRRNARREARRGGVPDIRRQQHVCIHNAGIEDTLGKGSPICDAIAPPRTRHSTACGMGSRCLLLRLPCATISARAGAPHPNAFASSKTTSAAAQASRSWTWARRLAAASALPYSLAPAAPATPHEESGAPQLPPQPARACAAPRAPTLFVFVFSSDNPLPAVWVGTQPGPRG